MSKTPLIRLRDVSRHDNSTGKQLLNAVSLQVRGGDRIGLVGASGSGKSTLLRAMAMLDRFSGELLYQEKQITHDAIPSYRREVIYMSQRPFFTYGTVEENLRLPFQFKSSQGSGRGRSFQTEIAATALDRFELPAQILDQPCESLSGGEQQMIALIRALLMEPRILLFDEPTAALDSDARDKYEKRIQEWHSESTSDMEAKRAFLWTSHDPAQVDRMTGKTITMDQGKLQTLPEADSDLQQSLVDSESQHGQPPEALDD